MNELLIRTIPNHRNAPALFKLYSNSLIAINESTETRLVLAIINAFVLKLTQWLGVQPSVTRCLTCEKTLSETIGAIVYAQISRGGWICDSCSPETRAQALSKDVIFDAYQAILNPIRKVNFIASQEEHLDLLQYLEQHLLFHVTGLERKPIGSFIFLKSST
jgi:DNA repair protein RecO